MEMLDTPGNLSELTPEVVERLGMAVASVNQTYVNEHHDDSMEKVAADYLAARQETLNLLHQFTDDQLDALVPTVIGDQAASDLFAGRAGHAAEHITWIEEGFRQGMCHSPKLVPGLLGSHRAMCRVSARTPAPRTRILHLQG